MKIYNICKKGLKANPTQYQGKATPMQAKSSNVFFGQGEIEHRRAYSDFIFPGNGWRSMSYIN
jgi:hypothetical protein